jgi:hypothetical protein
VAPISTSHWVNTLMNISEFDKLKYKHVATEIYSGLVKSK